MECRRVLDCRDGISIALDRRVEIDRTGLVMKNTVSKGVSKPLLWIAVLPFLFSSASAQLTEKRLREIVGVSAWSPEE